MAFNFWLMALQPCTFRVEYTLDNIPGREFGSIFIGAQNENVAASVVAAGWAKVRVIGSFAHLAELHSTGESYVRGTDVGQDQSYVPHFGEFIWFQASQSPAAFLCAHNESACVFPP